MRSASGATSSPAKAKPPKSRAPAYVFWGGLALLFFSQAVYLGLSLASLQRLEQSSRRLLEESILERLGRRLETIVDLGAPLTGYRGLKDEVKRAAARSRSSLAVAVDPSGRILAGAAGENDLEGFGLEDSSLEGLRLEGPFDKAAAGRILHFSSHGLSWRAWPLFDRSKRLQGLAIVSEADPQELGSQIKTLVRTRSGREALLALFLSAILTGAALRRGAKILALGPSGLAKFRLMVLGPFLLGQAAFAFWALPALFDLHGRQARTLVSEPLRDLASDIDRIRSMGVEPERIADLGRHLESISKRLPIIGRLSVTAGHFQLSRPSEVPLDELWEEESLSAPLATGGEVQAFLSPKALRSARIDLILDNLTLALISAILLMELVRLLPSGPPAPYPSGEFWPESPKPRTGGIGPLRPLAFGVLLASDLSLSFIPLKTASLGPSWLDIPETVLLGLPISVEMAAIGAATLFGSRLSRLLGGDRALLRAGLLAASLGAALSALAGGPLVLALARGLVGLGYGAFNMASHFLAASGAAEGQAGEAMGDLAAGFFSGGLCGCLIGGLLADRFGFDPVLLLAAGLLLPAAFLGPSLAPKSQASKTSAPLKSVSLTAGFKAFLTGRSALPLVLLSVVPVSAAMVGIINYFLPLHMASLGYGPSMISRLNVMMSLMIISLGPAMGRALDRKGSAVGYLALAGFAAALAVPAFLAFPTLGGAMAGMALMGLAGVVTETGHPAYTLVIPEAEKLGPREALGLLSGFTRAGQMCGPPLIGAAWGGWGLWGLMAVGGAMALSSLAFYLASPAFFSPTSRSGSSNSRSEERPSPAGKTPRKVSDSIGPDA